VLFQYCAEEVASARHTALFQRFIKALTRGPRPIEMHAADPRRYVLDMMAWVHQSLASGGCGAGGWRGWGGGLGRCPKRGGGAGVEGGGGGGVRVGGAWGGG
jgi:hypothetical protein